jgi:hypothetical protein
MRSIAAGAARRLEMSEVMDDGPATGSDPVPAEPVDALDALLPVAVWFAGGEDDLGLRSLGIFSQSHGANFRQLLLVSIGVMDYAIIDAGTDRERGFEGTEEAQRLRQKTRASLDPLIASARRLGLKTDCRISIATDPVSEIDSLSSEIAGNYPRAVFFVSTLVFEKPRWYQRLLFGSRGDQIRKLLEKKGFPVTVLPVLVPR